MWKPSCVNLLIAILLSSIGCREREPTIDSPEGLDKYAALPGLSQSSNPELQAELARLVEEKATPLLLQNRRQKTNSDDVVANTSQQTAQLDQVFPKAFRSSLRERQLLIQVLIGRPSLLRSEDALETHRHQEKQH